MNYGEYGSAYSYVPKERGGCLSLWLVVICVLNAVLMVLLLPAPDRAAGLVCVGLLAGGFSIACAVALWNWKKWGYFGLMLGYIVSIALNVFSGAFPQVIGGIIGITITYALVNPKMDMLE